MFLEILSLRLTDGSIGYLAHRDRVDGSDQQMISMISAEHSLPVRGIPIPPTDRLRRASLRGASPFWADHPWSARREKSC